MAFPEISDRLLQGVMVGMLSCTGGLWMLINKSTKQALALLPQRQAAALMLAVMASLLLAGYTAGKHIGKTPLPAWAAAAGAWLAPVLVWFTGLEPAWPWCWAAAWGLAFVGSWVVGVGLVAARKRNGGE